ncbi:hypothetical protein [Alishewanella sp. SMS8]|uniref:hypothetical protein n=1 Tax=Alishewanella sp. SMS8 TaxID=2994676 RepID=UPI002740965F|nr:hypothetical protein [Alishewanella sp. SMS8]MDP5205841.1 hypothetical protein [Alishewanella sp. SMS9]MDP5459861.1 hypothetical protein [Alishewanella sp. SMS8]
MCKSKGIIQKIALDRATRRISTARRRYEKNGGPIYQGSRKNPKHSRRRPPQEILVVAPSKIDLSKPRSHKSMVEFILNIERACLTAFSTKATVKICFRDTRMITASGGIYILATTDVLVKKFPNVKFSVTKPPSIPHVEYHASISVVHNVLCQIGFYKLLNVKSVKSRNLAHVECWHVETSTVVDSEVLGKAIEKLTEHGIVGADLFRAGIEAMANATEHAYSDLIPNNFSDKRWWLFTAVLNNELIVYICDLGHGIPKTLPYTQNENILKLAFQKFAQAFSINRPNSMLTGDVLQIALSTFIRESRTELAYRGKGGEDIKSFIDKSPNAKLHIYSNTGFWKYVKAKDNKSKSNLGLGYNNSLSINGTIVGWSVPL